MTQVFYSEAQVAKLTGKERLKVLRKQTLPETHAPTNRKLLQPKQNQHPQDSLTLFSPPTAGDDDSQEFWVKTLVACKNLEEVTAICAFATYVHQDHTRIVLLCHLLTNEPSEKLEPIYRHFWKVKVPSENAEKPKRGRSPDSYTCLHKKLLNLLRSEPEKVLTDEESNFLKRLDWTLANALLEKIELAKTVSSNLLVKHPRDDMVLEFFAYKQVKNFAKHFNPSLTKQEIGCLCYKISYTDSLTEFCNLAKLLFAADETNSEPLKKRRKPRMIDLAASVRYSTLSKLYLAKLKKINHYKAVTNG